MSAKKWILMFSSIVLLVLVLCAAFNVLTDPFGVFGDPILQWDSYNMTNNPRVAKIAYLDEHHGDFDSYIIGSSSAASYDPEELNEYLDAKFYNLFVYGCSTEDYCHLARYVLEHYEVKNLILNLGINEANEVTLDRSSLNHCEHAAVTGEAMLPFYLKYVFCNPRYGVEKLTSLRADTELPQAFDCFHAATGCYDKRVRDVEALPAPGSEAFQSLFPAASTLSSLPGVERCAASVAEIRNLCEEKGVALTVILSPVYIEQWKACEPAAIAAYKTAIAAETDYWDFSYSSVSLNSRYFYDDTHFRNAVGSMILAKIFGNTALYVPEDFGTRVTSETLPQLLKTLEEPPQAVQDTVRVPVLMYHHFCEEGSDYALSGDAFRQQLAAITEAGYKAVSMEELYNFVYRGGSLPEKPFCITMDDGYLSNYEVAWPILQEFDQCATIFTIGVSVGKSTYKDTEHPITPHFSYEQAVEMMNSGVMDVQCHTFDLHQWAEFESGSPVRNTVAQLPGESDEAYRRMLLDDLERFRAAYETGTGREVLAYAYPEGVYSTLSEVILHENGIPITISTDTDRHNDLVRGLPQSLYALCRMNVSSTTSIEEILAYLGQ